MAQLRQDFEQFQARNTEVLVIGKESLPEFKAFWRTNSLPFTGLPDPKHVVLELYGQQIKLLKLGRMPAQVLVDHRGIVRFVHYGNAMMDIPETTTILSIIDEMNRSIPTGAQPD